MYVGVYFSDFWYNMEWQVISAVKTFYCIRHSKGLIRFPVIVIRKCFWICIKIHFHLSHEAWHRKSVC